MKNVKKNKGGLLKAAGIASLLAAFSVSGHAQTLLANFQASSFNSTNDTLTDSVGGVEAYAVGSAANTAGVGDVNIGSGFEFNADSISGLEGLTSYTIAIGFTSNATHSEGILGADIPGAGAGDVQLASENASSNLQLHSLLGNSTGGDHSLYSVATGNYNYNAGQTDLGLVGGSPTGAVIVVNGTSVQLYVNGTLQDSQTFSVSPFGYSASSGTALGTATSTYEFGIGNDVSNSVDYNSNALEGDVTQFQIYSGAESSTNAEALSLEVAAASTPEPSTWALMACGLGLLAGAGHLRRRALIV